MLSIHVGRGASIDLIPHPHSGHEHHLVFRRQMAPEDLKLDDDEDPEIRINGALIGWTRSVMGGLGTDGDVVMIEVVLSPDVRLEIR